MSHETPAGVAHRLVNLSVRADGIAVLLLSGSGGRPFILNDASLSELETAIDQVAKTPNVRGLLIRAAHPTVFCAGADIEQIAALKTKSEIRAASRRGQELFCRIEDLPFPTAALIAGTCVGGGLELALACTWRVVAKIPETRLGLPEVQLGILPAWGGTTRLPLLVGVRQSLPMLLTGKTVDADTALMMTLADAAVPPSELEHAAEHLIHEYHHGMAHGHPPTRRTHAMNFLDYFVEQFPGVARWFLGIAKKKARAQTHGHYPSPTTIVEVMRASAGEPRWSRLDFEREAVVDLITGPVARRLIGIYLKNRDKERGAPYSLVTKDTAPIQRIAVIGAGVMGQGIATLLLQSKKEVRLIDPVAGAIGRAKAAIETAIRAKQKSKKPDAEAEKALARLTVSTDFTGLDAMDLVIEATPEKIAIKKSVLETIAASVRPDAIIATNTSSLSLAEMSAFTADKTRFAGLHFFNPAPKMPLVELGRAKETSDQTLARLVKLARELQKTPVVVADAPAFAVNRILAPYLAEAMAMANEGADPAAVDRAMRGFGLPMGPFELMDTVGIDVILDVSRYLASIPRLAYTVPALAERMVASGTLGKKSGVGFYNWRGEKPREHDFDETASHARHSSDRKVALGDPDEVRRRLLKPLRHEAQRVLDEGVVLSAADLDLASIFGMGFPAWTGGIATWISSAANEEARA